MQEQQTTTQMNAAPAADAEPTLWVPLEPGERERRPGALERRRASAERLPAGDDPGDFARTCGE